MKIAYVLDTFPVLSETFILREILELRRRNHDITVISLNDPDRKGDRKTNHPEADLLRSDVRYVKEIRKSYSKLFLIFLHMRILIRNPAKYIRLYRLCKSSNKRTIGLFRQSAYYARMFEKEKIEHIHSHFALNGCTLTMLISAWTGITYSFTIHAHDIFIPDLAALMKEKLTSARFVVSISQYNKQHLLREYRGIDEQRIKIVRCGIDITQFAPRTAANGHDFTIVSVGRLHPQKGFKYLICACELLKERYGLQFSCNVVGDGEERNALERLIRDSRLERHVNLLGAADQHRVKQALETADVFVLPCVCTDNGAMDGIPVALMEAMAMEVPVISTRISGIPELLGRGGGIVVEPENIGDLCDATRKVAALTHAERRAVGMRGREVIERSFNLRGEVDKLSRLFTSSAAPSVLAGISSFAEYTQAIGPLLS